MVMYNKVNDSGNKEIFKSGYNRDSRVGKGRYDLIPPEAIRRLAQHFENGANKYGDRNWEKGCPASRYLDSALRHLFAVVEGREDEDHAAAVLWNVSCFIATKERIENGELPKELNDI